MDANTSFSIVFFPRTSKLDKNGLARIYLRITVDGRRTEISVKRKIAPDQWCAISNRAKTKGFNQVNKQLNRYLDEIKARIYGIQSEYVTEGRPYTATTIKDKFLNRDKPVKTLLQIYDDHNSEIEQLVGSSYSYGGFRRHVRTRNHLADYLLKRYGQADIFVCEIDLLFINRFHHYLKIQKIGNQNTVTKYVTNFKKIMRIAFANNWVDKDPFFHWQANWKKVEREVLTEVDLLSIIEKELPIERLNQVRDLFVFCCFTGLAYVDVKRLSKRHITRGPNNQRIIRINRSKTDTCSTIPLLPAAERILSKYNQTSLKSDCGQLLPVISNQKTNAFLKEIAVLCNIDKRLTFHLARHTFATTVTLSNGIPLESVSKMLGHTSLKTTQIYAKVLTHKLAEDMKVLNDRY